MKYLKENLKSIAVGFIIAIVYITVLNAVEDTIIKVTMILNT